VQAIGEVKRTDERFGIAFGWRTLPDGRQQSQLRARVLLKVGFTAPLLLSVKSTLSGDMFAALLRQYDVLDEAVQQQTADHKPVRELPFYAFSLTLALGNEVLRGARKRRSCRASLTCPIPSAASTCWYTTSARSGWRASSGCSRRRWRDR
jgi:hypothetical protein